MSWLDRIARNLVLRQLAGLTTGSLTLTEGGRLHRFGGQAGPTAVVDVIDDRFFRAMASGGHIGAAESFAAGWWTTADVTALVRLFLANRDRLDGIERGWAAVVRPFRQLAHAARRNSKRGSRRNIAAHYDLSNDFFRLFLDETMTYSSAYFDPAGCTLAEAQRAKYDRICRKLDLRPEHHVIEIGTGWGGFALHAALHYGCRVTTTTISAEQHLLARQRIHEAGLDRQITVVLTDYRDLEGQFDRLVSIEMIEAVGHQYLDRYFEVVARLLTPDGLAAIQSITIQDRFYESARREVDFIKRHIFPGSCIPAISALMNGIRRTDLRLTEAFDFGPHYARTLAEWRCRFVANSRSIAALGFDQWFQRLWLFYFGYCEGGFLEGTLGVSQLIFAKPGAVRLVPAVGSPLRVAA